MLGLEKDGHLTEVAQVEPEKLMQTTSGYDYTFLISLVVCIACGVIMDAAFEADNGIAAWAGAIAPVALAAMGLTLGFLILQRPRNTENNKD